MLAAVSYPGRFSALLITVVLACTGCASLAGGDSGQTAVETHTPDKLKLFVAEDGLYRLTSGALSDAGLVFDQPLSYDEIYIGDGPAAVPFRIDGDSLVFYGQGSDDRYLPERPYIIEAGRPGQEMPQMMASAAVEDQLATVNQSLHLEENVNYISEAREGDESDVWFWYKLAQQDAFEISFDLPETGDYPANLTIYAWGVTHNPEVENDHDFDVLVNDVEVGSVAWDGQVFHAAEVIIPGDVLHSGENKITLDNQGEGASFLDIVQINWLEVAFETPPAAAGDRLDFSSTDGELAIEGLSAPPIVVDISDPGAPVEISGWQYDDGVLHLSVEAGKQYIAAGPAGLQTADLLPVVQSDWKNIANQADLIIIASDEYVPELKPLVEAREAEGLSVSVVPLQQIYDEFGYGAPSPDSIRSFVAYAYETWQKPEPQYLLLVGDATSDYRGYLIEPEDSLIPSPMVAVQFSGETVSDAQYADVDHDGRPELAVGRWPVTSRQQVADLVERTLAYEANTPVDRAIFATDGSEATFSSIAERLISSGSLEPNTVEQRDGPTAEEVGDLWRDGAWLATYIGHGSIDRWGKDNIFSLEELGKLQGESAPIVLQLTCLTGLFSRPEQVSLAEGMLLHPHGPVLIVAASSLTLSAHQEPFAVELLRQLQDSNIQRVGDAFVAAKQVLDVENSSGFREISDTFSLFGDPSAKIARP